MSYPLPLELRQNVIALKQDGYREANIPDLLGIFWQLQLSV